VIGLVQVGAQAMADRYTYVPLSGLFVAACWGLPELLRGFRHRREALAGVAAAVLLVLSILSFRQVGYWKDSETLFRRALAVTRNNWFAHNNLAIALEGMGRRSDAIPHYLETLRLRPFDDKALFNAGNAFLAAGLPGEAASLFRKALVGRHDFPEARINLGISLTRQGKIREAIPHYRKVLELHPDNPLAHYNLGVDLLELGEFPEAVSHLLAATRLQPGLADAHYHLGRALMLGGDRSAAVPCFLEALRLNPEDPRALEQLELARSGATTPRTRRDR